MSVKSSPRRISATFLCPHPAGYPGRPVLQYGEHEWRLLFQELKDLGIDTIILEKTADLDWQEVYYPSHLFAGFTRYSLLEPLLHAAAHEELAVFLGGTSQTRFPTLAKLDQCLAGYRELLAYRKDFHGFFAPVLETVPQNQGEAQLLKDWLGELCRGLRRIAPEMPILMVPGMSPMDEISAAVYSELPIDILAPRDAAGTKSVEHLSEDLVSWSQLSANLVTELWITVEPFIYENSIGGRQAVPTSFNRLRQQLEAAEHHSEMTVGWDVPYFLSRHSGETGIQLRKEYMENIDLGFVDK